MYQLTLLFILFSLGVTQSQAGIVPAPSAETYKDHLERSFIHSEQSVVYPVARALKHLQEAKTTQGDSQKRNLQLVENFLRNALSNQKKELQRINRNQQFFRLPVTNFNPRLWEGYFQSL